MTTAIIGTSEGSDRSSPAGRGSRCCWLPVQRIPDSISGLRLRMLMPKLIKDALLQRWVHPAVTHGSLGESKVDAVRPHVLDERHEAVGAIADEFGDQSQLKDNRGNCVLAETYVDVVAGARTWWEKAASAGEANRARLGGHALTTGRDLDGASCLQA